MYQIFVQDGNVIEVPAPNVEGISSDTNTINPEFCEAAPIAFDDRDRFGEVGGYPVLNDALSMPMVLVMSIWADVSSSLSSRASMEQGTPSDAHTSTTPTCSGSTPSTPRRRRASPARRVDPVLRTRASRPRWSLRCPMRTLPPRIHLRLALTSPKAGRLVQHPLRTRRLYRQGLGPSICAGLCRVVAALVRLAGGLFSGACFYSPYTWTSISCMPGSI